MKIWIWRFITFFLTLFLLAVVIVWLNIDFTNSTWRPLLYDLNLLSGCLPDPQCRFSPVVNYILIALAFAISITTAFILVRKNKIYFIPITIMFMMVVFIIGREIVDDLISNLGPDPVEVQIQK